MEKIEKRLSRRVEDLDMEGVIMLLERWNMADFVEFVRKKQLDGRKLLDVSEGIVKLWRPKANAKVFMNFIKDLEENPDKYVEIPNVVHDNDCDMKDNNLNFDTIISDEQEIVAIQAIEKIESIDENDGQSKDIKADIESQYQTVTVRKKAQNSTATTHNTISSVEELIRKLVPAKSFLYRNQQKAQGSPSYLPMDAGTPKKSRKFFRLSSYEYPFFDLKSKFSRQESNSDRGYYSMKRNSRYYIQKIYRRPEAKPKYKSISTTEELNAKYPEDHFYEDLNYIDIDKVANESKPEPSKEIETAVVSVKPCIVKIQELFHSFKVPFFRKHEMLTEKEEKKEVVADNHIYENSDSMTVSHMYDSVRVNRSREGSEEKIQTKMPVEDYLEPVQVGREYCDVDYSKQRDDSLLGYIMSIFESTFGFRRETNEATDSDSETGSIKGESTPDDARKWPDKSRTNMADRPLPVPVENESFYMNIDRAEAENLLRGQPDGSFVLRPSSQPNHAYTLTVSCAGAVHNVGVRRRPDGRLALGFARRGERSFTSVTSLLRHHRKRRLLLVAGGGVIGGTTLNETPHYYQSPSSIPIMNTATNS